MRKMKFDQEWRQAISLISPEAGTELESMIIEYQRTGSISREFKYPESQALFTVICPTIDRRRKASERRRIYRMRPKPTEWFVRKYPNLSGQWRKANYNEWRSFIVRTTRNLIHNRHRFKPDKDPFTYYLLYDILPKSSYSNLGKDLAQYRGSYIDYLHPHG